MIHVGDRIRLTRDLQDPDPIPAGATGEVTWVNTTSLGAQLSVDWDPPHAHRSLMILEGEDEFEVIP